MFTLFLYCKKGHYLSKSSLQLMLVSIFTSWNSENKRTYSHIMIHHLVHPHRIHLLLFKCIFFILTCVQVQFKSASRKVVTSLLSNRVRKLQTLKVPVQIKKNMFKQQM